MDSNGKKLNAGQEWGEEESLKERTCLICGCTDSKACKGGCSWLLPEVCSKCITETVPECIEALVAIIDEVHQEEIEANHYGDPPDNCTTCDTLKAAKLIIKALES